MLFSLWTWLVETITKGLYKIWKILWDIYKFDLYMTQKETNLYVTQKSWITFIQRKVINLRNYYECLMIIIVLILFISESERFPCGYFINSFTLASPYYWSPSDAVICRFSIKYMFLKIFRNPQEITHY